MKKIDFHLHVPKEDPTFEKYLRIMDRGRVTAALVHGVPGPGRDNAEVLRVVKAHPDRLFGSVHADLRRPVRESIALVRRYAEEGFRCVKLFPNLGFDPNAERLEPFWAAVEKLGLMCLSHCGWLANTGAFAGKRIESLLATPMHFEVPARRHPKINFIFAHFGGGWSYLETVTLLSRLPNCYADTCPGWGKWVFAERMPGVASLDFRKVLFGTDNSAQSGPSYAEQERWWGRTLRAMGKTPTDCRRHLYDNAAALLGLAAEKR